MSQQVINIGASPNDGTGDTGRTAWGKANSNFTELYGGSATNALITTNTLTLPGTYSGPGTAGQNFIGINSTLAGSVTNGGSTQFAPAFIKIQATNFQKTQAPFFLPALQADMYFGNSSNVGLFGGIEGSAHQQSQTGNQGAGVSSYFVGGTFSASAIANEGGTSGTANGNGTVFGANPYAVLASGATFWRGCVGVEINTEVRTGASVEDKVGLQIIQTSADAVAGTLENSAIVIGNQGGAIGWDYGLAFGQYFNTWPMRATGTLIGCVANSHSGSAGTTTNGVDLSNAVFTGSAYKSTGFSVDGSGITVTKTVKTTPLTVATLPAAATAGAGTRAFVTDANATTFASVVAGGGANGVPVYSDGTNWRIG